MKKQPIAGLAVVLFLAVGIASTASAQCVDYTIDTLGPAIWIGGATTDTGNHGDEALSTVTLPFSVTLYNTTATQVRAGSNGTLQFTTGGSTSFAITCLPSVRFTVPTICAEWRDQTTADAASGQGVFTQTVGASPNRQFVIEWRTSPFGGTGVVNDYEVIFHEGSSFFDVVYNLVDLSTTDMTIGVQASDATGAATQVLCHTAIVLSGAHVRFNCVPGGACCFGSCCTVLPASDCTSVYRGDGTTCSPNLCPSPVNDRCSGAIPVTADVQVFGENCNATDERDGPADACRGSSGRGIWFSFASPGGLYDISTCGSPQDTVVSVFTSPDCQTFSPVPGGCNDDGCGRQSLINDLDLPTGNYLIRVSTIGLNADLNAIELMVSTVASGACCDPADGACSIAAPTSCPNGGAYQGDGTVCSPIPCQQPVGACCTPSGGCSITFGAHCASVSGLFQGDATACGAGLDCPMSAGACCDTATGGCTYVAGASNCPTGAGVYRGDGSVCTPNTCPQPGACCTGADCTTLTATACPGDFMGVGAACDTLTCPVGACCVPGTPSCILTSAAACAAQGGAFAGASSDCAGVAFAAARYSAVDNFPIAIADGTPTGVTSTISVGFTSANASGLDVAIYFTHTWVGDLTATLSHGATTVTLIDRPGYTGTGFGDDTRIGGRYIFTDSAPTSFEAAAAAVGTLPPGAYQPASPLSAFDGAAMSGTWTLTVIDHASGETGSIDAFKIVSVLVGNPCPTNGACCDGSGCSVAASTSCTGVNTHYVGDNTVCNAPGNTTSPCCLADFNHAGGVSVQDIFDFLAGYFAADAGADINGGGLSVQDIFDFLAAFFAAGC